MSTTNLPLERNVPYTPFLTCGNKASKSFIKCLIRCVIPLDESNNTLCLFLFAFFTALPSPPFPSTSTSMLISRSSALRFPLRLDSLAFWALRTEAMIDGDA